MAKKDSAWGAMGEKKAKEEAEEGSTDVTFTKLSAAEPVKYLIKTGSSPRSVTKKASMFSSSNFALSLSILGFIPPPF